MNSQYLLDFLSVLASLWLHLDPVGRGREGKREVGKEGGGGRDGGEGEGRREEGGEREPCSHFTNTGTIFMLRHTNNPLSPVSPFSPLSPGAP